jgi:hypothetical protein
MKFTPSLKWVLGYSLLISLFLSASAIAGNPLITSSFSGVWDQPEQQSQGIILQIGEQADDEKVGIAYWFTYGPDLNSAWFLGVGPVTGNVINMTLYAASDIGFMAANLEGNDSVVPVGTLNLEFRNCNHGQAVYEFDAVEGEDAVEAEMGEFPIKRISSIYHQRCSGGISDDTPKHGKPLDLDVDLLPPGDGAGGKGKAKFWERVERTDFKVEVEDIPDGTYTLEICGGTDDVVQFEMPVALGEGELEFRSPESDDKINLNFDPRDCKIELLSGAIVVLTTGDNVLSEKHSGK